MIRSFSSRYCRRELVFAAAPRSSRVSSLYTRFLSRRERPRLPGGPLRVRRGDELLVRLTRFDWMRLNDPLSPRKFKIRQRPMRFRGERVEFPIVAVVGHRHFFILMFTVHTRRSGAFFGPSWLLWDFSLPRLIADTASARF